MKRFVANSLSFSIMAFAFAAQAQTVPFDLEIGYRWLDLKGSDGMYRTQINEREGLLIQPQSPVNATPITKKKSAPP